MSDQEENEMDERLFDILRNLYSVERPTTAPNFLSMSSRTNLLTSFMPNFQYGFNTMQTGTNMLDNVLNQIVPDQTTTNRQDEFQNIISSFNQALTNSIVNFSLINPIITQMLGQDTPEMHLIPQFKEYQEEDYEIAYVHFSNLSDQNPTTQILSYILDLNFSSGNLPSKEEIVRYAMDNSCICTESIEGVYNIYMHYIFNVGFIPKCNQLIDIIEYHTFHHEYPTEEQIDEIRRLRELERTDSERLHSENKVIVSCKNLDKLKPVICGVSDQNCGICLNELTPDSLVYKLPQCGHLFHSDEKDCLEKGCILTWLQTSTKCPLCKTEVVIEDPLESSDN